MVSEEMQPHLVSYRHEGKLWQLEIMARDTADAQARVRALTYAKYDGRLVAKIPVAFGPIAKLTVMIRNVAARMMR